MIGLHPIFEKLLQPLKPEEKTDLHPVFEQLLWLVRPENENPKITEGGKNGSKQGYLAKKV